MNNPKFYTDHPEWSVRLTKLKTAFPVYLQSEDFKHDVQLYINGDFTNIEEATQYAQHLANILNNSKQSNP